MRHPQHVLALPTVQPRRTRLVASKQAGMVLGLCAVAILGGFVLYLWPQVRLMDLGYRQNTLLAQRLQALQRQKELQVELNSLRHLPRVETFAVQRLGLRAPQTSQVIYVRPGQRVVQPEREPLVTFKREPPGNTKKVPVGRVGKKTTGSTRKVPVERVGKKTTGSTRKAVAGSTKKTSTGRPKATSAVKVRKGP